MSAATRGILATALAALLALGAATAGGGGSEAEPAQVQLPEIFTAPAIEEIRIEGVNGRLAVQVEFAIRTKVGHDPASANVERDLDNIVALGSFRRVEAAFLEGGRVLVFTLTPNPVLSTVIITGNTAFSSDQIRSAISADAARTGRLTLTPGQVVNTFALEDDRRAIITFYRSSGFPFDPEVRSVLDLVGEQLVITFLIEDAPLITGLRFTGASAFPVDQLAKSVAGTFPAQAVTDAPELFAMDEPVPFDLAAFSAAAAALNSLYAQGGFAGSGVDTRNSSLGAGVLSITLRELRIGRLSGNPMEGVMMGDLFNTDVLADAIDRAAEEGTNVEPDVLVNPDNTVSIRLTPGRSETITAIEVVGNAGLSRQEIVSVMRLGVGQPPNQFLLTQDLGRIAL
ncbi:MAG: hypothetical protein HY335_02880, partial [Deinococcus sp.]|nr:hypothetical protein [Deinococcus sp.]